MLAWLTHQYWTLLIIGEQSVAVSQCGTFAVVGSAGGSVDLFNLQSGLHRQSFPSRLDKSRGARARNSAASTISPGDARHTKAVTGLMIDNLNRTVVSCSLDGKVKVSFPFELVWHNLAYLFAFRSSFGTCYLGR